MVGRIIPIWLAGCPYWGSFKYCSVQDCCYMKGLICCPAKLRFCEQESLCTELAQQIVDGKLLPQSSSEEASMLSDMFQGRNENDLLALCSEASER